MKPTPPNPTSHSAADSAPLAHSIDDLVEEGPFSRSFLYEAMSVGRLRSRKAGRRRIVLHADWEDYLNSLPEAAVA